MTFILSSIFFLISVTKCQTQILDEHKNQYNSQHNHQRNYYVDMIIVIIGMLIVIGELVLWRDQRRQKSIVDFSVFSKELQDHPSHSISHSDFTAQKTSEIIQQQTSKDDSPGIKVIKNMTESSVDEKDQQGKKKRRRKADKLSDRRARQQEQN